MSFDNIPDELKQLKQWCLWKYKFEEGKNKPTKVPYAITGYQASPTNPDDWTTFDNVVHYYNSGGYDGIGFVFTDFDPYAFIDLDATTENSSKQLKIFQEFDSYSEKSPSGKGLHIIVKGSIPQGRKRFDIEIYSSKRYATMTGNIFKNGPIQERHDLLNQLFEQMGGPPKAIISKINEPETLSDKEIIKQATDATNGYKFSKLYAGEWEEFYPQIAANQQGTSEACLGLMDMFGFYTQNRNQLKRMFLASKLGNVKKYIERPELIDRLIELSFDRLPPKMDFDGYRIQLESQLNENSQQLILPLANGVNGSTEDFGSSSVSSNPTSLATDGSVAQLVEPEEVYTHNIENDKWFLSQLEAGIISVTENGIVTNHKTGRQIGALGSGGYPKISLTKEKDQNGKWIICHMQIHRLVWLKYKGLIPQGYQLNHKDLNKSNPSLSNLELLTPSENMQHALEAGVLNTFKEGNTYHELRTTVGNRYGTVERSGAGSNPATPTNSLQPPSGLVGEIAQFIYQAAPRPVPEIAIAGAIGLMAGICGRAYNVSGTGLNQYILCLAMTGAGKEAMASGIDKIINSVQLSVPVASEFIGPSEIASGQALIKYLANKSQSFVSVLGEFGLRLRSMSAERANSAEIALRRMLLDLYNKSGYGQVARPSIYADSEKNTNLIMSPAFSILGESTPERFYDILNEEMISEGLLPRFMLIEYNGPRPSLNEASINVQPSDALIQKIATLMASVKTRMAERKVTEVISNPEADKMLKAFDKLADSKINATEKDIIRQLWNRAHIKLLKISALLAVGVHPFNPIITPIEVEWARNIVESDIKALSEKFEKGEIGKSFSETKQLLEVKRILVEFITMKPEKLKSYQISDVLYYNKFIPIAFIQRRLLNSKHFKDDKIGATNSLNRALKNLIDTDYIAEVPRTKLKELGVRQKLYMITNMSMLNE